MKRRYVDEPEPRPDYANASGAARLLGVQVAALRRWMRDGLVASHKPPGSWRVVNLKDLERFIREQRVPPPNSAAVLHIEARLAERRAFERKRGEREAAERLRQAQQLGKAILDEHDRRRGTDPR